LAGYQKNMIRYSKTLMLMAVLLSGCAFTQLDDELEKLDDISHLFTGSVSSEMLEFHSIVVVALGDERGEEITSFRMMAGPGVYEIRAARKPTRFFAFGDMNKDLRFQIDEPYGWATSAKPLLSDRKETRDIDIVITADSTGRPALPQQLVGEPLEKHLNNYGRHNIGRVTSLQNPWFSDQQAKKGLWQPFRFLEDGGTGIHFLQPYDPHKVPVLFVHGITGTPRNFATFIEQLDDTRFQAWVLSYPSGLRLSWLARGLYQFLEVAHRQYGFDKLHLVAHSMGGLVSRGSVNLCVQNETCKYLRSYTTLSTPWNGVASAQSGAKWAPTVVPVWWDLAPDSEYVTTLFETPLPRDVPYHLLFGFQQDSIFAAESSDGVIKLTSQLRDEAQRQAWTMRGYDENHVSILRSQTVINKLNDILSASTR
jgi:pimeloyl-ACP methyl ester carboxylesterase